MGCINTNKRETSVISRNVKLASINNKENSKNMSSYADSNLKSSCKLVNEDKKHMQSMITNKNDYNNSNSNNNNNNNNSNSYNPNNINKNNQNINKDQLNNISSLEKDDAINSNDLNTSTKVKQTTNTLSKIKGIKSMAEIEDIKITNKIIQNQSSVQKDYNILFKIGKGSFGSVFKVYHKKTKQFRAMKVIKKETVNLQDDDRTFLKEIEILIKSDHPNIIRIYEYFVDDINYYLIMELVSGGELYDTITSWKEFSERKAAYIMKQILSAVSYLHANNITHRDLKPENMLVENKNKSKLGEEEINIKIIDFGTCNFINKNSKLSLKVGSPYYIAPEVLKRDYNEKCDIWSCGVILFVLLVGYPPFSGNSTEELLKKVSKGEYSTEGIYWKNISKEAKTLVKLMLEFNPKKRISAEDALNTPWIVYNNSTNIGKSDMLYFKDVLKNIKNFDYGEKFQQATIAYIVHFLFPSNEIEELKKVFKMIDKNGDGRLQYDELIKGFEMVYGKETTPTELKLLIGEIDGDADGYISYEEFLRVAINKNKLLDEKNLKLAFDYFDVNNDGKLSLEEIKSVLGTNQNDYVSFLIKAIDKDGNEYIDFEEFKSLMKSLIENKRETFITMENKTHVDIINKINNEDNSDKNNTNNNDTRDRNTSKEEDLQLDKGLKNKENKLQNNNNNFNKTNKNKKISSTNLKENLSSDEDD